MRTTITRIGAWTFIASVALIGGCASDPEPAYRSVPLQEAADPLAPRKEFPVWHPPKQFAVWVLPHRDRDRQVMVGGHWLMLLLTEGDWYFEEGIEREPVPDAEASSRDIEHARSALVSPGEAAIPYRLSEVSER